MQEKEKAYNIKYNTLCHIGGTVVVVGDGWVGRGGGGSVIGRKDQTDI